MTLSYHPTELTSHVDCQQQPSAKRASCGKCDTTVAGGSIVTGEPDTLTVMGEEIAVALRTFYCPHCEHLVQWLEAIDRHGKLTGQVISGPGYQRGAKRIKGFLKNHPNAAGVLHRD